jgi:RecA-family ATPase
VIDEYIRLVADKSIARRIMAISSAIIARAADQSESATQTLAILEAQLVQLKDRSRLLSRIKNPEPFFVGFRTFLASAPDTTEWTVEGLIQKDGNGLILGDPGTSKSLAVFDLALHLVGGVAWFHHKIPQRVKVGLVTREDAPGLSQSRLKRLKEGASESLSMFLEGVDLEDWLYVHTRTQRETWTLQKEADVQEIIESIKERGIQICFFDVFRVLWHGNENDSQETAAVLETAKRIGREAKCQVGLVHHVSKSDRGTIFDRARGSGILGWREWALGISIENPDAEPKDQIRKVEFQTKQSAACSPIYYRIDGYESVLKLEEVNAPTQQYSYHKGKKKDADAPQSKIPYKEAEDSVPF